MKDLTEHLKQIKIKAIGFDYTDEKECLKNVKINGYYIRYIYHPSEAVQLIAVNDNGNLIQYIKNPTDNVIMEAVRQGRDIIRYVDVESLSEEVKDILMLLL